MNNPLPAVAKAFRSRRWLRVVCYIAGSLFALALIALVAIERWLIPRLVADAETELASLGIHISYRDPDLKLFRGSLVIKDLTLYRSHEKENPVLFLSDLGVKIDLDRLISGHTLWGDGSIRDGRAVIYGEDLDTEISALDAELEIEAHEMRVTKLSGIGLGCNIALTSLIRWADVPGKTKAEPSDNIAAAPKDPPSEPPAKETPPELAETAAPKELPPFPGGFDWLEQTAALFSCKATGSSRADLTIDLQWDLTKAPTEREDGSEIPFSQLTVDGQLAGRDQLWLNLPLDEIDGKFRLEDWQIKISKSRFIGLGGQLTTSGSYDLDANLLALRSPVSTMQPIELCSTLGLEFAEDLKGIEFDTPPTLKGKGLLIDFNNPSNTKVKLTLDAPSGLRFRRGKEALHCQSFHSSIEIVKLGELHIGNIRSTAGGLEIEGSFAIQWDNGEEDPDESTAAATAVATPTAGSTPPAEPAAVDLEPAVQVGEGSLMTAFRHWLDFEPGAAGRPKIQIAAILEPDGSVRLDGAFSGSGFGWKDRPITAANLDFSFADDLLSIGRLEFSGLSGDFHSSGSFNFESRVLTVPKLRSTVDLAYLKAQLGIDLHPLIESLRFPSPPRLDADDLVVDLNDLSTGTGRIALTASEGFSISEDDDTLTTDRFELALVWPRHDLLTVEKLSTKIGGLEIESKGYFRWATSPLPADTDPANPDATASGDHELDDDLPSIHLVSEEGADDEEPSVLAIVRDLLTITTDGEPVRLSTEFGWDETRTADEGIAPIWAQLEADATIDGKDCVWGKLPIKKGVADATLRDGVLLFDSLHLHTDRGEIRARAGYQFTEHRLLMESIHLTLDPLAALRELGIEFDNTRGLLEFPKSPVVEGTSLLLDFEDMTRSQGDLVLKCPGGIVLHTSDDQTIHLDSVSGAIAIRNGVFSTDDLGANFLGGSAIIDFRVSPYAAEPWYEGSIEVKDISLDQLDQRLNPGSKSVKEGTFDVNVSGKGGTTLKSFVGKGHAVVDADEPVAHNFPVFDSLIGFLETLVPVLKSKQVWSLDLPFTIADGAIRTEKAKLSGPSITAVVNGVVDVSNNKADIDVGVNLRGLIGMTAGVVTSLFGSNLIDIKGLGPLDDIEWGLRGQVGVDKTEKRRSRIPRGLRR